MYQQELCYVGLQVVPEKFGGAGAHRRQAAEIIYTIFKKRNLIIISDFTFNYWYIFHCTFSKKGKPAQE